MSQEEKPKVKRKGRGYGERKITDLDELKTLVWGLDLDEGIRFVSTIPDSSEKGFVFLTKCGEKICVTIKERIFDKAANAYIPGGKEVWKYFETPEEAWVYVSILLKPPIEAYYY